MLFTNYKRASVSFLTGIWILGHSLTIYLIIHDLTTTSRNNVQYDAKIVLITIIIALLFPNSSLVICSIFFL